MPWEFSARRRRSPGQRDTVVGQRLELAQLGNRVLDQRLHRHARVHQLVHEGRVGAVLQQAPDQVRQQVLVRADRGVDAHVAAVLLDHRVVQRVAHAVQALELEVALLAAGGPGFVGQGEDGGHGVGVVAGELRVDHPAGVLAEQVAGAGQVGSVGAFLAGVDGVAIGALHLALLDLAVPVGTLHQAQRDACAKLAAEQGQPYQHRQAALGVGLDDQAELAPAGDGRVAHQLLVEFEGQLQAIGFLGVDGDADVQLARAHRQFQDIGEQLAEHPLALRHFVARMQRRELDRDRRPRPRTDLRLGADGVDGLAVVGHVFLGVGGGQRGLAEHVEGIGVALLAAWTTVLQRFGDGPAKHELLAHQLHRLVHRGADHRFAGALHQPADDARGAAVGAFVDVHHLAGHHQAPGGEIDQNVVALAEMALPVGGGQLVADQRVGGRRVRHTQQRLGQTHQHQAFLGVQAVLAQECVEGIDGVVPAAHGFDQCAGVAADSLDAVGTGVGELQQFAQVGFLVDRVVGADDREEFGCGPGLVLALQDVTGFEHHALLLWSHCY